MIYLVSWVWLEYGLAGEQDALAREAIDDALDVGGVVSTIALTEVDYVLSRDVDRTTADLVTSTMEDVDGIHVVPVSSEVALFAPRLRSKYYERGELELSYADAIHLATATLLDCDTVYTGDSDFEDVDEIETIVY